MIGITRTRQTMLASGLGLALSGLAVSAAFAQQVRFIDQPSVYIRTERTKIDDPDAPARLSRLIDELGSPDFTTRCKADRALAEDGSISLDMIEQALKKHGSDLSLDTRERLCSAARTRFNQTPRAAMGIQFWQYSNLRDRVVIERTFPKFDSSNKLEDGDMIVEADGVKLSGPSSRTKFQSVIVSHDPGDVIPLVVRRGDRKLDTQVRLGRRDELENNAGVTPDMLERAWRVRAESILGPDQDPIRPPTVPEDWNERQAQQQPRFNRLAARQKMGGGGGSLLVGGGMPRGAEQFNDPSEQRQFAGGGVIRRNGQIIINGMVWIPGFDPLAEAMYPPMKPQEELTELTRARAQFANVGVKGGGLVRRPDGQVVILQDLPAKDVQTKELQIIEKQISAIKAEMTENGLPLPDVAEAATHDNVEGKPGPGAP